MDKITIDGCITVAILLISLASLAISFVSLFSPGLSFLDFT